MNHGALSNLTGKDWNTVVLEPDFIPRKGSSETLTAVRDRAQGFRAYSRRLTLTLKVSLEAKYLRIGIEIFIPEHGPACFSV